MHQKTLFNSTTIIQQKKKRDKNIYNKKRIGNNISVRYFVIIKWKFINNNIQKKGEKN